MRCLLDPKIALAANVRDFPPNGRIDMLRVAYRAATCAHAFSHYGLFVDHRHLFVQHYTYGRLICDRRVSGLWRVNWPPFQDQLLMPDGNIQYLSLRDNLLLEFDCAEVARFFSDVEFLFA